VHYGCCVDIFHWTLLFGLICAIAEYRSNNGPPPVGARKLECIFLAEDKCGESLETRLDAWLLGRSGSEANIVGDQFAFVMALIPDLELRFQVHRTRVYPWREGE
jgi:hypothetical protein